MQQQTLVPKIIQEIFEKYETGEAAGTVDKTQLFIELESVFGVELVENALRILDEYRITLYTINTNDESDSRCLVEIAKGKTELYQLLPGMNYCNCSYFRCNVLHITPADTAAATVTKPRATAAGAASYTCKHVLALRLARILKPKNLLLECISEQRFVNLESGIFGSLTEI